jgi:DNA-binding Lrp family transcriptional regulator
MTRSLVAEPACPAAISCSTAVHRSPAHPGRVAASWKASRSRGAGEVIELAQRVALSVAPCHWRLRELERTGVIRGYRAIIDPAAVGHGFEVLMQVTTDREDASTITEFERGLAAIAEVRHAERLFGDPDYLVRVATAGLDAYQALRDDELAILPGAQRLASTIVMKRIIDDRPHPTSRPAAHPHHRQ